MPQFVNPFSGNNIGRVLTKDELLRALRFSVAAEYEAVQNYTQMADSCDDPGVKKTLQDIANEEIVHAGEFLSLIERLNPDEAKLYKQGEKETKDNFKDYVKAAKSIYSLEVSKGLKEVSASLKTVAPEIAQLIDRVKL